MKVTHCRWEHLVSMHWSVLLSFAHNKSSLCLSQKSPLQCCMHTPYVHNLIYLANGSLRLLTMLSFKIPSVAKATSTFFFSVYKLQLRLRFETPCVISNHYSYSICQFPLRQSSPTETNLSVRLQAQTHLISTEE